MKKLLLLLLAFCLIFIGYNNDGTEVNPNSKIILGDAYPTSEAAKPTEWTIDEQRALVKSFLDYCYEKDYITKEEYDKEVLLSNECSKISSSTYGYSGGINKDLLGKYQFTFKNY